MKFLNIASSAPFVATAWLLVVTLNTSGVDAYVETCVDAKIDGSEWTTADAGGIWNGKTCSDIAEMPTFWCDYLEQYNNTITSVVEDPMLRWMIQHLVQLHLMLQLNVKMKMVSTGTSKILPTLLDVRRLPKAFVMIFPRFGKTEKM